MTMTLTATLKASLDNAGASLTQAKKDQKRFNIEVSAAKILRKGIAAQLTELNKEIKSAGKGGHRVKAANAARDFLRAQYSELLGECSMYKFQRMQLSQYVMEQTALVRSLDAHWEEAKANEKAE